MSTALERERAISLAAKLYAARDGARQLLGARYGERMAALGAIVKSVQTKSGTNEIQAAQQIIREGNLQGFDAMQVLASAVELVEPST